MKVGDTLMCIKSTTQFKTNKLYMVSYISDIYIYIIGENGGTHFFFQNYYIPNNKDFGRRISNHFCTKKELRKTKLDKING